MVFIICLNIEANKVETAVHPANGRRRRKEYGKSRGEVIEVISSIRNQGVYSPDSILLSVTNESHRLFLKRIK